MRYYACELHPDDHLRTYHTRMALLDVGWVSQYAMAGVYEDDLAPMTQVLVGIPGVEAVQVYRNRFSVRKSPVFSWDEIESTINPLLRCIPLLCGAEETNEYRIADKYAPESDDGAVSP